MPGTAVYICECMGLVSDFVDTASLEQLARGLPGVALVKREGILCGGHDLARWTDELKQSGVDRLLYAGCSPRMSLKLPEELLLATAAAAGLDPGMVEVANIREQCAWLHREDRDGASAKARDMLRMAHARLQHAEPTAETVPLSRRVLVIGGGPAGLAAARDLSRSSCPVTLVEKNPYLGGKLCQIPYIFQNAGWPATCESQCTGPVHARDAMVSPQVTVHTSAEVTALRKEKGNFVATIGLAPAFVDPDLCIACGKCEEVCPEETDNTFEMGLARRKAIAKPFPRAVPDNFTIVDQACTRCGDCLPVCPTGAIDLEARPRELQQTAGAVILSTGTEQRDPARSPELGSGAPNVITALQMERLLHSGLRRPSDGEEPEHVVFVQCAGSRAGMEKQGTGVPYCSKTCCSITAKQAKRVAQNSPMSEVSVLYYRDFRTYERALEKLHQDLKNMGIEFHNGEVTAVEPAGDDGELAVTYNKLGTEELEQQGAEDKLECDLVVLACAQESSLPGWATDLGLPLDIHGFPIEGQPRLLRPTETFVDRVFTAGAALGPKAIQPSIEQGSAAALKALQAVGGGEKQPDKYASAVDQELCSHCGVCVSVCPHGAIQMTEQGSEVDPAFCQACGMCGASCPSHAATLRNFSDQRLLLEAAEAFSEAPPGEPRILALLCYWCSYGGVDLTGVGALDVPTCVRTMRIRCSSSVNMGLVLEMFRMGVDGIFVGGCPEGSCHHMWGNWLVQKRTAMMKSLLNQMGLDERRLRYDVIGIPHAQKFADEMHKMRKDLGALGHNPWAREESVLRKGVEASWLAR